jgi:signal transduction histidine kinase
MCGIEFPQSQEFGRLPRHLESAVFRVAEELITNACRHSGSEKLRVELAQEEGRVRLEVQDWGIGFDPAAISGEARGLREICVRIRLLGGEVTIDAAPGKGTHVTVLLPTADSIPQPTRGCGAPHKTFMNSTANAATKR